MTDLKNKDLTQTGTGADEFAVICINSDCKVINWNAAAERLLGYKLPEIVGKHFGTLQSIENLRSEKAAQMLKSVEADGKASAADWHVKKDGSHFWANLLITRQGDTTDGLTTYLVEMRPGSPTNLVTEKLRARNAQLEEQLDERTAQLGARTAQLGERTDELGSQTTELSERTSQLSAKTKQFNTSEARSAGLEEQLGERTAQLGERTAQLGARTVQLGVRTEELGSQTSQLDERTSQLNAKTKQFNISEARSAGFEEKLGERTAQLGVRTDELGLQTSELGERTAQLSAKALEFNTVEALNKELEAFTYAASHDLRAPLRSIDGFSQVLLEDYGSGKALDETGIGHLKRIRACAQRMGQLIDDLIGLSSLTRGTLKRSACDLSMESQKIATELQRAKPERKVTFDIAKNMLVECDISLIRVVLENLLGNAFKYTSKVDAAKIEVGSNKSDNGLVYFVRDNGAGFDMKYVHKLFGPFQRLHSTTEFEGNGIGLATVQRIVNRHGGQVWAEGEVDKGTTIFFTL